MVLLARDGAIFCSTAAIVPCVMATSRMAETPFLASITWPPLSSRSYWVCAPAHDARTRRRVDRTASALALLRAAFRISRRRFRKASRSGIDRLQTFHDIPLAVLIACARPVARAVQIHADPALISD